MQIKNIIYFDQDRLWNNSIWVGNLTSSIQLGLMGKKLLHNSFQYSNYPSCLSLSGQACWCMDQQWWHWWFQFSWTASMESRIVLFCLTPWERPSELMNNWPKANLVVWNSKESQRCVIERHERRMRNAHPEMARLGEQWWDRRLPTFHERDGHMALSVDDHMLNCTEDLSQFEGLL